MEKKEWTPAQKEAIECRNKNMLVSAGAGSGKTAVLKERVLRLVAEDGVPVDAMLIVTFTRAAAGEMRDRIRKALKEKCAEQGLDPAVRASMKKQLAVLPSASIQTFDSFAKSVTDEFFYLADMEPGRRVADETEARVMRGEALEELFEREYEEGNEDFLRLLDHYSTGKSDENVKRMVESLYDALTKIPDRDRAAEEKIEELRYDAAKFRKTAAYRAFEAGFAAKLSDAAALVRKTVERADQVGLDAFAAKCEETDLAWLTEAGKTLEAEGREACLAVLRENGKNWAQLRISKKEFGEETAERLKKELNGIRDRYKGIVKKNLLGSYAEPLEDAVYLQNKTHPFAVTLYRLVKRYREIFAAEKRDRKVLDYDDIEDLCLEILSDERAASHYREKFRYIFIDEYQDTNLLQETIIDRIRRKDDLFMVGDVKQSIYRFRLADPGIFTEKYAAYKEQMAAGETDSVKIDLNTNFRSKSELIDEINRMFRTCMEGYDRDAELRSGVSHGDLEVPPPKSYVIDLSGDEEEGPGEEIREIGKQRLEAIQAADIVEKNLGAPYFDSEKGEVSRFDYKDMVIIMRSFKSSLDSIREVFRERGIPLYVDDTDGYMSTFEINVMLSLLTVIDNKRQDVPFLAVLRSEIFGFTCAELAAVRKCCPYGSYVSAAKQAASDEHADPALREKLGNVFASLDRWQQMSVSLPLPEFIWKLLTETGYYLAVGAMPGGAQRQANLRLLVDMAEAYVGYSQNSLYGFVKYIETAREKDVEMPPAKMLGENDNVVRLMTVHHSKGLEFPLVIVGAMGTRLQFDQPGDVAFDRRVGIGLRVKEPRFRASKKTLMYQLITERAREEEEKEYVRLLYVAATRARERLYFLGSVPDYNELIAGYESGAGDRSTLLGLAGYLPDPQRVRPAALAEEDPGRTYRPAGSVTAAKYTEKEKALVQGRLGFAYPYEEARKLPGKTTISILNQEEKEETPRAASAAPHPKKKGLTATQFGTVYHGVMERLDFVRASKEGAPYVRTVLRELAEKGIFTEKETAAVDGKKIAAFFESDLGKRAVRAFASGRLHREQAFDMQIAMSGEDVMIQGVMDLYFEEEDELVLVDYKTNRTDPKHPDGEKARIADLYKTQIRYYREALEEATGKKVKEAYLYLFSLDDTIKM